MRDKSAVRSRDERARAVWSALGATALAIVGVLAMAASFSLGIPFALLLGLGQLMVGGAILIKLVREGKSDSGLHVAGIVLAGVSLMITVVAPQFVLDQWAPAGLMLAVAAVVCLAIGRN